MVKLGENEAKLHFLAWESQILMSVFSLFLGHDFDWRHKSCPPLSPPYNQAWIQGGLSAEKCLCTPNLSNKAVLCCFAGLISLP